MTNVLGQERKQRQQAKTDASQCANTAKAGAFETHLLPFRAGCEKRDYCVRYAGASCDSGGMVDELVGPELEDELSADEHSRIIGNHVLVCHDEPYA